MRFNCNQPILLAGFVLALGGTSALAESPWLQPMQEFAATFQHLQASVKSGDLPKVEESARTIRAHANKLSGMHSVVPADSLFRLKSHQSALANVAERMADSAGKNDARHMTWYLEQVRGSCISCHIEFRDVGNLTSFYPAKGNTVIADVTVLNADGRPKQSNAGAVVFVDGLVVPAQAGQPRPIVSQRQRQFSPRVLPVIRGTTVDFPNDDSILHNVFSLSKARRFDLDIYKPGKSKSVTFRNPGLVRIYCNLHPEMTCSVLVLNNPFFETTDENGRCIITGIPDGSFALRTWQELGGGARVPVKLEGNRVVQLKLESREQRRSLAHRNKYGQKYKKNLKY